METLVPIPNTKVKNVAADGSAAPLLCESRSSPGLRTPVTARWPGSSYFQGSPAPPAHRGSRPSLFQAGHEPRDGVGVMIEDGRPGVGLLPLPPLSGFDVLAGGARNVSCRVHLPSSSMARGLPAAAWVLGWNERTPGTAGSWVIRLRRRYSGWAGVPEGRGPTRSGTGGEFAERDLRRRGLHQALLDQGELPGRGIAPQVGFACLAVGM